MTETTGGLKYVIGLFCALGLLLICLVLWQAFGKPSVRWPDVGVVHPPQMLFTLFSASVLFLAAYSLSRTTSRWAWILALLLNVLLLGSVLIIPLLVASLAILLKRNTRERFGITKEAPTTPRTVP